MTPSNLRLPTVYLPHGGGPWPWMDMPALATDHEKQALTGYLAGLVATLPHRPKAMVVVSAHWEERVPTVMTHPHPPMFYDYSGFPPETYHIPGPRLATRAWPLAFAAFCTRRASIAVRTARAGSTMAPSCP